MEESNNRLLSVLALAILGLLAGTFIRQPSPKPEPPIETQGRVSREPTGIPPYASKGGLPALTLLAEFLESSPPVGLDAFGQAVLVEPDGTPAKTQDALRRLRDLAKRRGMDVEFVIASLPDWVDSNSKWLFDAYLDVLQKAAAAAWGLPPESPLHGESKPSASRIGYVLDSFYSPEGGAGGSVDSEGRARASQIRLHEKEPAAVLFRQPTEDADNGLTKVDLLLVLIVGETATSGVHKAAFANAIDIVAEWNPNNPVRVLGPTFSGSAVSLHYALEDARSRHCGLEARVVSGSATSPKNPEWLNIGEWSRFQATTCSDDDMQLALARYLTALDPRLRCGEHVALIVESNTMWGAHVAATVNAAGDADRSDRNGRADGARDQSSGMGAPEVCVCESDRGGSTTDPPLLEDAPFFCATVLRFPLHISRLRSEVSAQARAVTAAVPSSAAVSLRLGEDAPPIDRLPSFSPELTAATSETVLAQLFRAIDDSDVTAVGIFATDKRDHVFLAQQLARRAPNVMHFMIESDLLLLHPDASHFTRGTVVASPYSLNNWTRNLNRWKPARQQVAEFTSAGSQGIHNAFLALLGGERRMRQYGPPLRLDVEGDVCLARCEDQGELAEFDPACTRPPVWISVVGRDMVWPVVASPLDVASRYAMYRRGSSPSDDVGPVLHPPFPVVLGLLVLGLVCAGHGVIGLGLIRAGRRPAGDPGPPRLTGVQGLWKRVVALRRDLSLEWARDRAGRHVDQLPVRPIPSDLEEDCRRYWEALCSEHRASVFACGIAVAALALWTLMLVTVWAADRLPGAGGWLDALLRIACGTTGAAALWFAAEAFWPPERRWIVRPLLFLLGASFAFYCWAATASADGPEPTIAVLGWSIALLAACAIGVDGRWSLMWRRVPLMAGLAALGFLLMHLVQRSPGGLESILEFKRATTIGSFVSPAPVVIALCGAAYWWGVWNRWRLRFLPPPDLSSCRHRLLKERAESAGVDARRLLGRPELTLGGFVLLPAVSLAALGFGGRFSSTVDGWAFGRFVWLGSACVLLVMTHTLAHSAFLGREVLKLLEPLNRHPVAGRFAEVGQDPFRWRMSLKEPKAAELEPLQRRIMSLAAAFHALGRSERPPSGPVAVAERRRLLARPPTPAARTDEGDERSARTAMVRIEDVAWARSVGLGVDPEDGGNGFHDSRSWYRVGWLSHALACWLGRTTWNGAVAACSPDVAACRSQAEKVVAFHCAVLLRNLLSRLLSGFTMAIGGTLFVMTAHLFYAFQGRSFWLVFDWVAVGGTSLAAIVVLVFLEKDAILSRLWNTTPGRINLTSRLSYRIAAYATVTVITLFATFFPEVGGNLLGWLEPVKKVLP